MTTSTLNRPNGPHTYTLEVSVRTPSGGTTANAFRFDSAATGVHLYAAAQLLARRYAQAFHGADPELMLFSYKLAPEGDVATTGHVADFLALAALVPFEPGRPADALRAGERYSITWKTKGRGTLHTTSGRFQDFELEGTTEEPVRYVVLVDTDQGQRRERVPVPQILAIAPAA